MAITVNSPIAGASQPESLAEALAYTRQYGKLDPFSEAYIRALYRLCVAIGLRFEIAFGQWCDETGIGTSELWAEYHNPAGIGKLTDGTYVGINYATPDESALGHLVHLWLYVNGPLLPVQLAGYVNLDPRWKAAQVNAGKGSTLAGLAGTWADNPAYATQIAGHANKAFGVLPERPDVMSSSTIIFGKVPAPVYVDDYIASFPGQAWDDLGQRTVKGVVWHRMVGYLQGTRQQFRIPGTGLTDFGVGVGGWDDQSLDGILYRWNDPLGRRAGWANGPASGAGVPWGDGLAFVKEFGINAVNRDQVSLEISGNYGTPLTAKARATIVAFTAYWADVAKVPWDSFPIIPGLGFSFVRWHNEFCGQAYKLCPGDVVMGETATLLDMVKARLQHYQTGSVTTPVSVYATPNVPAWLTQDLKDGVIRDHVLNGTPVTGAMRQYKALRKTARHASASLSSKAIVGPPLEKGEVFTGTHLIGTKWVLTPHGTRVYLPDLSPGVIITPRSA